MNFIIFVLFFLAWIAAFVTVEIIKAKMTLKFQAEKIDQIYAKLVKMILSIKSDLSKGGPEL